MKSREDVRSVHDLRRKEPLGPARMRKLAALLKDDLARIPTVDEPAEVREARQGFEAACAWATGIVEGIETAEVATREAKRLDVTAAAEAMRDGSKTRPKVMQLKTAEGITGALVGAEAAEVLLLEAHERYIEAAHKTWATWRRSTADAASSAHASARRAMNEAEAAVVSARERYHTAETLDSELLSRYPEERAQADAETRSGLPWYLSTHTGARPLKRLTIPDGAHKGRTLALDMETVLGAVVAAVEGQTEFPAADWSPPVDPEHETLMAAPVDVQAGWVKAAVGRAQGVSACVLCGNRDMLAELVVTTDASRDGAGLELAHPRCLRKVLHDPKVAAAMERERRQRATWNEHGNPPQPGQEGPMYE